MKMQRIVHKTAVIGLLSLGISACGGSENSMPWSSELRDNFMTGCLSTAELSLSSNDAYNYCSCLLDEIEGQYSATEFLDAEQRMLRGENTGIDLEAIAQRCL